MIFLHGGPGFRDYLAPFFGDMGFCYDQRGTTLEELIAQLAAYVGDRREILVGHSWGSVLAMEFARRHPDRVAGLVSMSSCLSASQWKVPGVGEAQLLAPSEVEVGRPWLEGLWRGFSKETFAGIEPFLRTFEYRDVVWGVPVLHVYGTRDGRFPLHDLGLPSRAIANVGHFPFLTKADEVRAILRNFAEGQ